MQEVSRAVERIDDPNKIITVVTTRFFRHEPVAGIGPVKRINNNPLGILVDRGNEVMHPLTRDFQRIHTLDMTYDERPGRTGGTHGNV
jgi:hypothetical protein